MEKRNWTKSGIILVVAALLATFTMTASNATTLKVGIIADFTGTASVTSGPLALGMIDYLKYVNDSKKGVEGNLIDIDWVDGKFKTSLAPEAYHRMKGQNALTVVAVNSPYVKGVMPFIVKDQMPLMTVANNLPFVYKVDPNFPSEWVYSSGGCAAEEYTEFVRWALANWKEKRPIRLALVYPDDSYGKALVQGFPDWVKKQKGVEIVGEALLPSMNVDDATPYLIKIKKFEPDYVLVRLMANGIAVFLKDAKRVGMTAPIVGNYVGKPGDIERLVASPDLLDQFMIADSYGVLEDTGWGMVLADKLAKKYQGKDLKAMGSMYWMGVGTAMIMEEALRLAVKSEGAAHLNSALLKTKGYDRITHLDTGGIMGTVTVKPGDHRGAVQNRIIGYKNGKLKVLRDWTNNEPFVNVK